MEKFERLDSLDVTFADSFTRKELKIREQKIHRDGTPADKGVGEKRIYCGADKEALDRFFCFQDNPVFFIQKDDLEEYAKAIEQEYKRSSYNYGEPGTNILKLYNTYIQKLKSLSESRLYLHFSPTYDKQRRYYLVLPKRKKATESDHLNYAFIHDICLPRVTRLLFIKLREIESGKIYIYLKPFYGTGISTYDESIVTVDKPETKSAPRIRKGQTKYKEKVFKKYPYCVVTKVTDPNLLIACHIKNYADCSAGERFDEHNGFTMTPTIHTLFDKGYLTFDNNGEMVLSDFFRNMDRRLLHLDGTVRVLLSEESKKYLEWHNNHTFMRTSKSVDIV